MATKQQAVRAFWEVPVQGRAKPAIVPRERVLETPRYMKAIEADLRRKILAIVEDAEGLELAQTRAWWTRVAAAARTKAVPRPA